MNEFLKVYRSSLNALALILMLMIPFLQFAAASSHSFFFNTDIGIVCSCDALYPDKWMTLDISRQNAD